MRTLRLTEGPSAKDTSTSVADISWDGFSSHFDDPHRTNEDSVEWASWTPQHRAARKDRGWHILGSFAGSSRKKADLVNRDAVALDMDRAPLDYDETLRSALKGWAYIWHTTASHTPGDPRLRLIVPLSRPITPDEYQPVARWIAGRVGIRYFDATTYNSNRVMYWPVVPSDCPYEKQRSASDVFMDPDEVLAQYDDWRDADKWPRSPKEDKPRTAGGKTLGDPRGKLGVVGAWCRAYGIDEAIRTFLADRYTESGQGRWTYNEGTTANGAIVYDDQYLYSNHESDPCSGRSVSSFDLVRLHLFGHLDDGDGVQYNRLPSFAAMAEKAHADDRCKAEMVKEAASGLTAEGDAMAGFPEVAPSPDKAAKYDTSWMAALDLDNHGCIKPTFLNTLKIVESDPRLKSGGLAMNSLEGQPVARGGLPWMDCLDTRNGRMWTDNDDLELKAYLASSYRWGGQGSGDIPKSRIQEVVLTIAGRNRYSPLVEYLEGLEWDGEPRVEQLFIKHFGTVDDRSGYVRAVARKFMCGAVARALEPGCKWDYVPILEGPQGLRKSMFIQILSDPWWAESIDTRSKEAVETMQGSWLIELAELEQFGKAESEHLKAFITRRKERCRLAYGHWSADYPRQCAFVGTTNSDAYLKDETGNRRYWPITCNRRLDDDALRADRDQLWAEAVQLVREGELLYLDDGLEAVAASEQNTRYADDGLAGLFERWLDQPWEQHDFDDKPPAEHQLMEGRDGKIRTQVCAPELLERCLGGSFRRDNNPAKMSAIRKAMARVQGWHRMDKPQRFSRYGVQRGWARNGIGRDGPGPLKG